MLLVHTVTVTPYAGRSSTGDLWDDPFPLPCMAQGGAQMIRLPDGTNVTARLVLYAAPGQSHLLPPGSKVEWDHPGGTLRASVAEAYDRDSGPLGAPDHTEVVCL